MIERKQDYQLTVPVVPPGGVRNVPLTLETDAPFALRLVKSRNIGLNGWRFQTPRKVWQSNQLRTDWSVSFGAGSGPFPSQGAPIYPEMVYPIGSQIVVDIGNDTDEDIINARLLFRGVKLFRNGALSAPTYPAQFNTLPFTYPVVVQSVGLAASATRPFTASAQLQIKEATDFVFRYGVCDPFFLIQAGGILPPGFLAVGGQLAQQPNFDEVYVMLRDESRKAYSNEPIHINDIFGQGFPLNHASGSDYLGAGPVFPGLIIPEIYIPRNASIYFDIFRFDTTGVPVDLHFRFQGAKVALR